MRYLASLFYKILVLVGLFLIALIFFVMTTAGLNILIKLAKLSLPGHLNIQRVDGSLIKGISFSELRYSDTAVDVNIIHGDVVWKMTMSLWHQKIIFNNVHIRKLHIHIPDKEQSKKENHHDMTLPFVPLNIQVNKLTIDKLVFNKTQLDNIHFQGSISNTYWAINKLKVNYDNQRVDLQAHGELQNNIALSARLDIMPISSQAQGIKGRINLTGDKKSYQWHGKFTGLAPITVRGELKGTKQFDTTLTLGLNKFVLTGDISKEIQVNASIPQPQDLHPVFANIKTTININGFISAAQQASLTVRMSQGFFQMAKESAIPPMPFQGGRLSIHVTSDELKATGQFTVDPNKQIQMSLRLPEFNWYNPTSLSQPVDGKLNMNVTSLAFLQEFSPLMSHLHGKLSAELTVHDSLGNPNLGGKLKLIDAGLSIPEAGITLNSIQAELNSSNQSWDMVGSVGDNDGHEISIKGQGKLSPQVTGSVVVNADNFPVVKTAEYTINVSPKLMIGIEQEILNITGTILIPYARFKPMVFSDTETLTDDAIFIDNDTKDTASAVKVSSDIRLIIGQDVAIDTQGLHGLLGGEIQVTQPADGLVTANGELNIRDGSYKAYGQDLAINHGKLIFSGATPSNPKISLRAVRSFNNTSQFSGSDQLFDFNASNLQNIEFGNHITVGIEVGGNIKSPKIKLFSIPSSLSQSNILSLLLLGKPVNQASQSGGQLLLTAISGMNLDSGTKGMQLLSQLKEASGLDFDIKSASQSNRGLNNAAGNTSLVVGKSLGKRLYLSYSIGMFQENSNVIILKYLFNKYFSIQVTASVVGSGGDILYSPHSGAPRKCTSAIY